MGNKRMMSIVLAALLAALGLGCFIGSIVQKQVRNQKIQAWEQQRQDKEASKSALKANIEELNRELDSYQEAVDAKQAEVEELNASLEQMGISRELADGMNPVLEARIAELEGRCEKYKTDIQESLLYVMQMYYEANNDFTTDEPSMGDMFTDDVIGLLSGGSSTVEATLIEVKNGFKENRSAADIAASAVNAALTELPQEICQKTVEFMLGGTIMKGLDILVNMQPSNQQLQHLLNQLGGQMSHYRTNLIKVMGSDEVTVDDLRLCSDTADALYNITYLIEKNTNAEAGSDIWKFCSYDCYAFYENYLDLQMQIAFYQSVLKEGQQ